MPLLRRDRARRVDRGAPEFARRHLARTAIHPRRRVRGAAPLRHAALHHRCAAVRDPHAGAAARRLLVARGGEDPPRQIAQRRIRRADRRAHAPRLSVPLLPRTARNAQPAPARRLVPVPDGIRPWRERRLMVQSPRRCKLGQRWRPRNSGLLFLFLRQFQRRFQRKRMVVQRRRRSLRRRRRERIVGIGEWGQLKGHNQLLGRLRDRVSPRGTVGASSAFSIGRAKSGGNAVV